VIKWNLDAPYLIAHTEDGYCRHLDRAGCRCTVREQRPIPCRVYDCRGDTRIWSDFANYMINPEMDKMFTKKGDGGSQTSPLGQGMDSVNCPGTVT
jgi:Fe-S-cluster containining protein